MKKLFVLLLCCYSTYIYAQNWGGAYNSAYNYGYGLGMYEKGKIALSEDEYDDAFECFTKGTDYHPICYEGVGVCYELGFGVEIDYDEALEAYRTGATYGIDACKSAIIRIKREGFWPKSRRSTFLRNLKASMNAGYGIPNVGYGSGYGGSGSSGSSGSSSVTCSGCHGTGKCTGCAGRGQYMGESPFSGDKMLLTCPVCNGSGRCGVCYGRGSIR